MCYYCFVFSFMQARKGGDNSSDRSGEITPSDSGRGGSEDDLNTSILLSHCSSIDFGRFIPIHVHE